MRFGGTLDGRRRLGLGFDHVCIAAGAGKPTFVADEEQPDARASAWRPTSSWRCRAPAPYSKDSLANLQMRLPAVVIGGGLTAIDTATELQAYYVVQVEKILDRYERLVPAIGEEAI